MKSTTIQTRQSGVTPCVDCPLRKLAPFRALTARELAFVAGFKSGEARFEAGDAILTEGERSPFLVHGPVGMGVSFQVIA